MSSRCNVLNMDTPLEKWAPLWCRSLSHRYFCTAANLATEKIWLEKVQIGAFGERKLSTQPRVARRENALYALSNPILDTPGDIWQGVANLGIPKSLISPSFDFKRNSSGQNVPLIKISISTRGIKNWGKTGPDLSGVQQERTLQVAGGKGSQKSPAGGRQKKALTPREDIARAENVIINKKKDEELMQLIALVRILCPLTIPPTTAHFRGRIRVLLAAKRKARLYCDELPYWREMLATNVTKALQAEEHNINVFPPKHERKDSAECMLWLGDISKRHHDMLKAVELWQAVKPLFAQSSQVKHVEHTEERLAGVGQDILEKHRNNIAHLAELDVSVGIVEELDDDFSENERWGNHDRQDLGSHARQSSVELRVKK
ncbi:hypothetical protein B0H13DRAFT_1861401 [Mycena leptocephala]|nr:hypothetical protein B0H13DRAFT_1861401 [Mycena leptocephala]